MPGPRPARLQLTPDHVMHTQTSTIETTAFVPCLPLSQVQPLPPTPDPREGELIFCFNADVGLGMIKQLTPIRFTSPMRLQRDSSLLAWTGDSYLVFHFLPITHTLAREVKAAMSLAQGITSTEALHQGWAWGGPNTESWTWSLGPSMGWEPGEDEGAEVSVGGSTSSLAAPEKVFGF